MTVSLVSIAVLFTLVWFVMFWLVSGVMFAVVALARFIRLNKAQFSCLLTIFSLVAAAGAAWMGVKAAYTTSGQCLAKIDALYQAIPGALSCAPKPIVFSAVLWFVFLLALGIGLMFFSRLSDRPRT